MLDHKFPVLINPFGVLYNPASVRQSLEILLDKRNFKGKDLYHFNEQWLSFYHDTEFNYILSGTLVYSLFCIRLILKIHYRRTTSYKTIWW